MNSKSDTIDAEIEKLLLSFIEYANKDLPVDDWINDTKAKLKALLLRERQQENRRSSAVWGGLCEYDKLAQGMNYSANRDMELEAELSRLSGEESHE